MDAPKLAALHHGTGGGSGVRLPIQQGANAMYGIAGVHGQGDYGSNGVVFVDLLGGPTMGTNIMDDHAYASATGLVDYVCKDDQNVAIRVNSGGGEIYFYVHLIDNANLYYGHSFNSGALLGTLKHGTFQGTDPAQCGAANQQDTTYHIHWGFVPEDGQFQAGPWILDVSSERWSDGTREIRPGQIISNTGVYVPPGDEPPDDTGGGGTKNSFFDMLIGGLYNIVGGIISYFPQHEANGIFVAMVTAMGATLRIIYTISDTVLNLAVLWAVLLLMLILEGLRLIVTVLRFLKKYIPGLA